jgi:hypothetical protein
MVFNVKDVIKEYIQIQIEDFNRIESISDKIDEFTKIKCTSSNPPDFSKLKFKNVLYYFVLDESNSTQEICKKLEFAKANSNTKFPKVNNQEGTVLYVGKSSGLFSNRIKQHFGYGSKSTYALHLKEWKDILGKDVGLTINYISLHHLIDDNSTNLLEIIESSLHYKLKPILGRIGH